MQRLRNRLFLVVALCSFSLAAVPACSGGDDDDDGVTGNGDMITGSYVISASVAVSDECLVVGADGDLDDTTDDIEVTGTTMVYNGDDGTIEAGVYDADGIEPLDFNDDPFGEGAVDCVMDLVTRDSGFTTAENEADNSFSFTVENPVGPDCDAAEAQIANVIGDVTIPCTSEATYHITYEPPPPALTGTVTSMLATGGQLTIIGDVGVNAGYNVVGTLDAGGGFSDSGVWTCYAPDLAGGFPNYDLFLNGGIEYTLSLSVTTADWAAQNVPISNLPTAVLSGPSSSAALDPLGDLEILQAPMVVDSAFTCSVALTNVTFTDTAFQAHSTHSQLPKVWKKKLAMRRRH